MGAVSVGREPPARTRVSEALRRTRSQRHEGCGRRKASRLAGEGKALEGTLKPHGRYSDGLATGSGGKRGS